MQKMTLLLFVMCFSVSCAFAEIATHSVIDEPIVTQSKEEQSVSQKQIIQLMESDISFEREKRQLSNEVALEKLRAELKKVRSDSEPAMIMSGGPEAASATQEYMTEPQVLATSRVGGVSKIAVNTGRKIILVDRNEVFDIDGKKYRLLTNSKKKLIVGTVAQ